MSISTLTTLVTDSITPWTESSRPLYVKTPHYESVVEDVVLRTQLVAVDNITPGYLCESLDELDAVYTVGMCTYR